jgi:hypothetical protein
MSKFKSTKHMERKLDRAIRGVCRYWDGRVEAAMKTGAPWTDRTTNARNGLSAEAVTTARGHAILLSHSVSYGIYLETLNGERYAIILPTIRAYAPKVIKTLTKILGRLDTAVGGST